MATNGHRPAETRDRKRALIVGAVIAAVLVFGLGYLLGAGDDEESRGVAACHHARTDLRDELAEADRQALPHAQRDRDR